MRRALADSLSWMKPPTPALGPNTTAGAASATINSTTYVVTMGIELANNMNLGDVDLTRDAGLWFLDATDINAPKWNQRPATGPGWPSVAFGAKMVYMSSSNTLVLFGGMVNVSAGRVPFGDYTNRLSSYSLDTGLWTDRTPPPSSSGPYPRSMCAFVALNSRSVLLYGGRNFNGSLADTWLLDTFSWEWSNISSIAASPQPGMLDGASAAVINGTVYLFGGFRCYQKEENTGTGCYSRQLWSADVKAVSPTNPAPLQWKLLFPLDASTFDYPNFRTNHTMVAYGTYLIINGGVWLDTASDIFYSKEPLAFDTSTLSWVPLRVYGDAPLPTMLQSTAMLGDRIFLWGGLFYKEFGLLHSLSHDFPMPDNCFLSGVTTPTANKEFVFNLQMRASGRASFASQAPRGSDVVVLPPLSAQQTSPGVVYFLGNNSWATGAAGELTVYVISRNFDGGDVLVVGSVKEQNGGQYRLAVNATYGSKISLYVRLRDADIPGSPLQLSMRPGLFDGASTLVSGRGAVRVMRNSQGNLLITLRDR